MKDELLKGDDEIRDHLDVHVVDNGNTLKEEEIAGDHVYFHPNPNTGGSGGFARGMIEVLHQETPATHILLMDDDVLILPESIRRTYHLLRLVKPEHKDRFINGAMLRYEAPVFQHEDLGTLSQSKLFQPLKPIFHYGFLRDVLSNEGYFNAPCTYAAWWYCCIPMETVKRVGLPMPFFVRGDDSEYSLRSGAKFISMNGICVWHLGFSLKFNAAMDIYQQFRNLQIVQASSDFMKDIDLHATYCQFFKSDLRKFNYNACELYLKAMADFLKGPKFLETADGEALLKENSAMNEKTEPLRDHPEIPIREIERVYEDEKRNFVKRFQYRLNWHLTDNGQRFSNGKQKNTDLPVAAFDFSIQLTKQGGVSQYAAVNPYMETVAIRRMDPARYKSLKKRFKQLEKEYKQNKERLEKEYHEAKPYLTSEEFWVKYLGLNK
jgi:GT2 family glycosyltransferase